MENKIIDKLNEEWRHVDVRHCTTDSPIECIKKIMDGEFGGEIHIEIDVGLFVSREVNVRYNVLYLGFVQSNRVLRYRQSVPFEDAYYQL